MAITVKFVGALRHAAGVKTQTVECEGCSVRELIDKVSGNSSELRGSLIGGEGENARSNALVLVNGREISVLNGLDTSLKEGDEVVFVPVVHGG
jgi:molybdopterin synthase sulfur carrier subunit